MSENGARVAWAGAGLMLPRTLLAAAPMRWAVRRVLADPRFSARTRAIRHWAKENDGATRARRRTCRAARRRMNSDTTLPPAAAFYCVADERYFLGAVGMINSLRVLGHDEPVFLLDCGLTAEQRRLLARTPRWSMRPARRLRGC